MILIVVMLLTSCWEKPENQPHYLVAFDHYRDICLLDVNDGIIENITESFFTLPYWTYVSDFSDDGRYLLFTKDTMTMGEEEYMCSEINDIYCYDVQTGEIEQLTNNDTWETIPKFSPDGEMITFMGMSNGKWNVFIMNKDGSDYRNLVDADRWEYRPRFSADGQYLYYKIRQNDQVDICRNTPDGLNEVNLTNDAYEEGSFDISDDGNILYYSGSSIRRKDLNGELQVQLTPTGTISSSYYWPKLSPDGSLLSYVHASDWMYACLMNENGSDKIQLGKAFDSEFSPDGKYLFYLWPDGIYRYDISSGITDTLHQMMSNSLNLEVTIIE